MQRASGQVASNSRGTGKSYYPKGRFQIGASEGGAGNGGSGGAEPRHDASRGTVTMYLYPGLCR